MRSTIRGFLFGLTFTTALPLVSGAQPVLLRHPFPSEAQALVRAEVRRDPAHRQLRRARLPVARVLR